MTTYGGRSAQYVPGRDCPNKEPPVSKFVVEKLYKVHRLRMQKIEPLVDSHVHIPDFLTNTTWKKNAEISRKAKIISQNLYMYHRITKVANQESNYKKETKLHVKRIDNKAAYLRKLKEQDRLHKAFKIQRENEYILKRIEKAQPEYTKKKMDEWYKHHELFKAGRRTDVTAGHIMVGMGSLLPPRLPPLNSVTGSFDIASGSLAGSIYSPSRLAADEAAEQEQARGGMAERTRQVTQRSLQSNSMLSASYNNINQFGGMGSMDSLTQGSYSQNFESVDHGLMQQSMTDGSLHSSQSSAHPSLHSHHSHPDSQSMYMSRMHSEGSIVSNTHKESPSVKTTKSPKAKSPSHIPFSSSERISHPHSIANGKASRGGSLSQLSQVQSVADVEDHAVIETSRTEGQNTARRSALAALTSDLSLLVSRPFALPFESKNCLVQVYTSKTYDENVYLKVVTSGISPQILCERPLQIDKAYEVVNAAGNSNNLIHGSENEDLGTLSALLINMFQEADDDNSGSLTFDEFQTLMEQVELGISPQELRFVISEADENENGVVDYEEFVPLAVDLIQSFRARNRAKTIYSQRDVEVDELIMNMISTKELEKVANICLEKIYEIDTKKYGLIRVPELKRCLNGIAALAGLKENEISMICQMLPKDQFDRCKYNTAPNNFLEILSKVRFMTMKNAMIESSGSGLQKYLLDLCREEEARISSDGHSKVVVKDSHASTGKIPFRALINILTNSSRLSLSRLQVLVIMSEAHVQEGMINYFQFVPVVAKAIEIMFEPKALRQRAELIEKTDLSPEALLQGMHSDMFEQRLMTLFKSYDIDKSGDLDQNEFIACLESLDLQLSYAEMVALMASADVNHTGFLAFAEFKSFFTHNLLNLEREKHVRLMQSSMNNNASTPTNAMLAAQSNEHHVNIVGAGVSSGDVTNQEQNEFIDHLTNIFKLSDTDDSGKIPFEEFENVLKTFNVIASKYLMDVMLSELHVDEDGMVQYSDAVVSCGELLKVYRAKESAIEEHHMKEEWANDKAEEIVRSHEADILHIVNFLKNKIKRINESVIDPMMKYNELVNLFRSPASGLARFEANQLITRLLTISVPVAGLSALDLNDSPANAPSPKNAAVTSGSQSNPQSNGATPRTTPTHAHSAHGTGPHKVPPSPAHHRSGSMMSNISSRSNKNFRSHFTTQELYEAVYDCRKMSVMRGLMEEIDSSSTRTMIAKALQEEASRLRKKGTLAEDSTYLPVKSCFQVLESLHDLRLNRSQILFVISWAECFDKEGNSLEMDKFAEHAASIVARLGVREVMETRAEVVAQGSFDEKKVLNGMRENELEMHLEYALASINGDTFMITPQQLYNVLKDIPRLNLSERDCTALIAPFDHGQGDEELFNWTEHLHSIVSMVVVHCRERIIHRRMSLHVTSSMSDLNATRPGTAAQLLHEEATNQLKQLADKLLNYVKIQMVGDNMVIHLPIDNEKRRTSQLGFGDEFHNQQNREMSVLYQGVRWIEWQITQVVHVPVVRHQSAARNSINAARMSSTNITTLSGSGNALTPTSAMLQAAQPQYELVRKKKVPVLVSVTSGERGAMQVATALVCTIMSADGKLRLQCQLPVKMPSLGIVDREAARQFAGNIADRMYVEEVLKQKTELKMKELS